MLRDFPFTLNPTLFQPVLEQFDMQHPGADSESALLEFKFVTPDSFIWKFLIDGTIYYLYAEDFIESLDAVYNSIKGLARDRSEIEFVRVKIPKNFEEAGPVVASTVYTPPADYENIKLYTADADYDFAFLVKSNEDPNEAYFSRTSS